MRIAVLGTLAVDRVVRLEAPLQIGGHQQGVALDDRCGGGAANAAVAEMYPGIRSLAFGHIGDGNIHYNLSQPVDGDPQEFLDRWDEITGRVADIALSMRGSFSAEHGIGKLKVHDLAARKSTVELGMMHAIKRALDPKGLMNPDKVLPAPPQEQGNV